VRTPLSSLTLLEPRTLSDALRFLQEGGPPAPLAGGTDIYVGLEFGLETRKRFLNLWELAELRGIRLRKGLLSLGALTTYTDLIRSPLVRKRLPILIEAARLVGGVQIQNRGTIGGNIANASPAGDTLPVLAVAEAIVVLRSLDGERMIPFNAFYTGYKKTAMRPDEIIASIEIPALPGRPWFRKVGTRAAQAISKVVMAAVVGEQPRIAIGSVAPTVVRCPRTEGVLASGGPLEEAELTLLEEIRPIDDLRSTAEYRGRVCVNLLRSCFANRRR